MRTCPFRSREERFFCNESDCMAWQPEEYKYSTDIGYLTIEIDGSNSWIVPHGTKLNHKHLFKEVFA